MIQDAEEDLHTLCDEIDGIVQSTLDTLVSEGTLSEMESNKLSQGYTKDNTVAQNKVSDIKKKQFKLLSDHMAKRKRSRRALLRKAHEEKRKEVTRKL